MSESFKLPGSSYEELTKIIKAYSTGKIGVPMSLDAVAQTTGMDKTVVSRNNGFLVGKSGIGQKSDALSAVLSKKHRGMIHYIVQVRNGADHGADADEGGKVWNISEGTAHIFPIIVGSVIKNIVLREDGDLYV